MTKVRGKSSVMKGPEPSNDVRARRVIKKWRVLCPAVMSVQREAARTMLPIEL